MKQLQRTVIPDLKKIEIQSHLLLISQGEVQEEQHLATATIEPLQELSVAAVISIQLSKFGQGRKMDSTQDYHYYQTPTSSFYNENNNSYESMEAMKSTGWTQFAQNTKGLYHPYRQSIFSRNHAGEWTQTKKEVGNGYRGMDMNEYERTANMEDLPNLRTNFKHPLIQHKDVGTQTKESTVAIIFEQPKMTMKGNIMNLQNLKCANRYIAEIHMDKLKFAMKKSNRIVMNKAVNEAVDGTMNISELAVRYGIPRKSLDGDIRRMLKREGYKNFKDYKKANKGITRTKKKSNHVMLETQMLFSVDVEGSMLGNDYQDEFNGVNEVNFQY